MSAASAAAGTDAQRLGHWRGDRPCEYAVWLPELLHTLPLAVPAAADAAETAPPLSYNYKLHAHHQTIDHHHSLLVVVALFFYSIYILTIVV